MYVQLPLPPPVTAFRLPPHKLFQYFMRSTPVPEGRDFRFANTCLQQSRFQVKNPKVCVDGCVGGYISTRSIYSDAWKDHVRLTL